MELVGNSRAVCSPFSRIWIARKHERRAQHERKFNPEMSGIVISSFSDDLEGCSKSVPPASSTKTFPLIGFSWDPLGIPNHRIACPKRCRGHLDGFLVELHRTSRSRTLSEFGVKLFPEDCISEDVEIITESELAQENHISSATSKTFGKWVLFSTENFFFLPFHQIC